MTGLSTEGAAGLLGVDRDPHAAPPARAQASGPGPRKRAPAAAGLELRRTLGTEAHGVRTGVTAAGKPLPGPPRKPHTPPAPRAPPGTRGPAAQAAPPASAGGGAVHAGSCRRAGGRGRRRARAATVPVVPRAG